MVVFVCVCALTGSESTLQVNGMNVRYSTHQQAVKWLIAQEGDILLFVRHVPQPEGLQVRDHIISASV